MANIIPKVNVASQATNAFASGIAAAAIDGVTEATRMPFLNDQAPIGGANMSISELLLYSAGGIFAVFGAFAAISKKKIAGIGSESIGTGLGTILGTYIYEQHLATMLGIRK
jgi:hypothetical protein